MKRRQFLKMGAAAGSGLAATTVAAPAIAQSLPEIKWRLASSFPRCSTRCMAPPTSWSSASPR